MIRFDERNGRWRWEFDRYIQSEDGSERVRKSRLLPKGVSEEQAQALAAKLEAEEYVKRRLVSAVGAWDDYVSRLVADKGSWLHSTLAGCRSRSSAKGRSASLTASELEAIMRRSRGRCEVSGIAFQIHKPDESRARPFFHSLDRVDSSKGYVAANCRLVCYAVNLAMSNWGEEVFAQIATGYIVNRYCALGLTAHALVPNMEPVKCARTLKLAR
jgi:hypothetical protein